MKARLFGYASRLKQFLSKENSHTPAVGVTPPDYNIPEIMPINCRESELDGVRLNLLIPALSLRFAFGGINTALEFFTSLLGNEKDSRIIITDEMESDLLGFPQAQSWKLLHADENDQEGRIITTFGDRYNKTIPVRKNDVFIATAWWTAYNGERILNWQQEKWGKSPIPLVYLIQDFEPGFYKWSSRYLLALSTYHQKNLIAVVNTTLLSDFIKFNGIKFNLYYIFEPTLNKHLEKALPKKNSFAKKRKIIFYGRPSVERNAFEVVVKALEYWSGWYPNAANWEVVSLGEDYPGIKLVNDIPVTVKGKVSLDEYADILLESAIGISFMISPHPSYPPLEMAAFDLGVITNRYFNKNLSEFHDNLFSLENISPENIALMLVDLCKKFEEKQTCFANKNFRNTDFLNGKSSFNFIEDLRIHLKLGV
jgi:O-antigen biosynthesis protein